MCSVAYKKKKDKIRPLNQVTDGEGPEGDPYYLEECEKIETYQSGGTFNMWLTSKFSTIMHGSRLTVERLIDMDIGAGSNNNTSRMSAWCISATTASPTSLKPGLYSERPYDQTYLLLFLLSRLCWPL